LPRSGHINLEKPKGARENLIAAYRQGLGLAAIVVIGGSDGIRIAVEQWDAAAPAAGENLHARYWCRRAADAERLAVAASHRLSDNDHSAAAFAFESIQRDAKRLNVRIFSDTMVETDALMLIDRIEREIERLRSSGGMRPINKSYQCYRLEATARGERVVPYAQWMRQYTENLVREAAATLKYL
jgi:hypothetical protein